jgi:hypothetical protein
VKCMEMMSKIYKWGEGGRRCVGEANQWSPSGVEVVGVGKMHALSKERFGLTWLSSVGTKTANGELTFLIDLVSEYVFTRL